MFYGTFKNIGDTDIAEFEMEQDRNDWVNFQDPFSKAMGTTADTCTFERMKLDAGKAQRRIANMPSIVDTNNPKMRWYIAGV